jgi:ATP-dependent DNA helicase RecQ
MAGYVNEKAVCLTKYICSYFGDNISADCGICDNCIRKNKTATGKEEFGRIADELKARLEKNDLLARDILTALPGDPDLIQQVISYLINEGKIRMTEEGKLTST